MSLCDSKEGVLLDSYDMRRGIIPGLIAGHFFFAYAGPEFQAMGVSFGWHIIISMLIGALYTGLFLNFLYIGSFVGGLIYGLIWWIVGWNIIMPMLLGGEILQFSIGPSFYGHIIFGQVLAFLVELLDGAYLAHDYVNLPKREHPAGYVYNISNPETGLTKIGRTKNPKRRMQQLRGEHGKQLRYTSLRNSENTPKDEKRLHKVFGSRRKDGEWFDLD